MVTHYRGVLAEHYPEPEVPEDEAEAAAWFAGLEDKDEVLLVDLAVAVGISRRKR